MGGEGDWSDGGGKPAPGARGKGRENHPPGLMGVKALVLEGLVQESLYLLLISHQLVSVVPSTSKDPRLAGLCARPEDIGATTPV